MTTLLTLTRGGVTYDLNDGTNLALVGYKQGADGRDTALVDVYGASVDAVITNLKALGAQDIGANRAGIARQLGVALSTVPTLLSWRADGATNTLESEVKAFGFAVASSVYDKITDGRRRQGAIQIDLVRQPYFEETAEVVLVNAQAGVSNNAGYVDIAAGSMRGDLGVPLWCEVFNSGSADKLIAAVRQSGDPTAFTPALPCNTDNPQAGLTCALGGVTTAVADALFSTGKGARVTPTNAATAANQMRVRLTVSGAAKLDGLLGFVRVLARVRESNATTWFNVCARAGLANGANYGSWSDYTTKKRAVTGSGTTLQLLDLGVLKLPPADLAGATPAALILEIWAESTKTSGYTTLDIDELILLPAFDACAMQGGQIAAKFPRVMSATERGVVSALERQGQPAGCMVSNAGAMLFGADMVRGAPLVLDPTRAARVYLVACGSAASEHVFSTTNTITIKTRFRYRYGR